MAGHSKWANIKHRKSAQDAKRGKIFTKLIREITIAARGGATPEDNPSLRTAIAKALGANMTRDTIDRAIAKGAGTAGGEGLEEITYEGYGPGGVALLVETATDNRNRTVSEVRHILTKYGGNMGTTGSVNYLFDRKGEILLDATTYTEEGIMDIALEAGAEDIVTENDQLALYCPADTFSHLFDALQKASIATQSAEIRMIAQTNVDVDAETAAKLIKLVDFLEDLDDTQNVYHNASISDQVLEQLNA